MSPGRVLAGEYPGSVDGEDVRPKLQWLLQNGVSAFVDLTEKGELEPYSEVLAEEAGSLDDVPLYQRRPIRDASTPAVEAMTEILDAIDELVGADQVVYVHCMVGLGRTGSVVGCYLVRHGMSGEAALEEIARLRRNLSGGSIISPYTEGQRNMVREWPE